MNAEVEVRLDWRGSGRIEGAAIVGGIAVYLDPGAPNGNRERRALDDVYAEQDWKMPGMSAGAAAVIGAVMIRKNLDGASSLDRGETGEYEKDQKDPADAPPASAQRPGLARHTHTWMYCRRVF